MNVKKQAVKSKETKQKQILSNEQLENISGGFFPCGWDYLDNLPPWNPPPIDPYPC